MAAVELSECDCSHEPANHGLESEVYLDAAERVGAAWCESCRPYPTALKDSQEHGSTATVTSLDTHNGLMGLLLIPRHSGRSVASALTAEQEERALELLRTYYSLPSAPRLFGVADSRGNGNEYSTASLDDAPVIWLNSAIRWWKL